MSREKRSLQVLQFHQTPLELAQQSYNLDCQARQLSPLTIAYNRAKLAPVMQFLAAHNASDPKQITPDLIRRYLVELQQTHNEGGVHGYYSVLRAFLRFLVREDELTANPLNKVQAPKLPKTMMEPVSLETVGKLLKACEGPNGERDTALVLTPLDSGLRAAELMALNVGDVDMASGRVVVQHGKGNKQRVVFLGAKARKAILKYLRRRGQLPVNAPLWTADNGDRLGYSGLVLMLRRWANTAKVAPPSPHSFRRAFALLSLRGGCDIYSLQKLMGHADLTVLRRYLAQTESDLQAAHEQAGPVDKMLGR